MALNKRHAGSEALFAYAVESASYPVWGATGYGTAPTTPVYGTFADVPNVVKRGNIQRNFGVGVQKSTHRNRYRREAEISGAVRLGGTVADGAGLLLSKCLQGSGGYKNLADVAIWTGASNRNTDGFLELYRFCKCAQVAVNMQEGQELTVTPTFWALGFPTEVAGGSLLSPSYATLAGAANPLSFVNRGSLPINGVEFADLIIGVQFTYGNSLQRRNTRNDLGENVEISRAAVALVPGNIVVSGNLILDGRISAAVQAAASSAANWTDIGDLPFTFADSALGGTQTITLTIKDFEFNEEQMNGGQSNMPLTFSVPFVASDVTLA